LPQKGIIELGIATRELRRVYKGLRCFVFSALAPYESSRSYAREVFLAYNRMGLWEGVTFKSDYMPEAEVVSYLHAMDLNVLPYRERGFLGTSAAVRTLMAARKPIITTDVSFFSDLEAEVYKIPSPRPEHIVGAVKELLEDRARREALVQRMEDYVKRNSWLNTAKRHLDLYRQAMEGLPGERAVRFRWTAP